MTENENNDKSLQQEADDKKETAERAFNGSGAMEIKSSGR